MARSSIAPLAMVALLIGIAVAGHLASPLLLPKADVTASPEPGCNLQQRACGALLPGGGRIELSIMPRPIPILTPLQVEATVTGLRVSRVDVDFAGETMNMGYNRISLAPAGKARHAGEASLPVCVSGGMNWVITVLIETDRQRIAVPYRVSVGF